MKAWGITICHLVDGEYQEATTWMVDQETAERIARELGEPVGSMVSPTSAIKALADQSVAVEGGA